MPPSQAPEKNTSARTKARTSWPRWLLKALFWIAGLATAGALALALTIAVALAMAYPNLPDVSDLADYRPKLPMRVYSAEGALLGEFGEERRNLLTIAEILERPSYPARGALRLNDVSPAFLKAVVAAAQAD